MIHELHKIFQSHQTLKKKGIATVLATVVALDGSSYRKPGVRMLLGADGTMIGAVSGGCVEKEVFRQAQTVFTDGIPKMMTYDGRYRLGCEGILYVLLERFDPTQALQDAFLKAMDARLSILVESKFEKNVGCNPAYGSSIRLNGQQFLLNANRAEDSALELFSQELLPNYKLVIIGAEHDAVQLCTFAALMGWEVTLVAPPTEEKEISHFPGARYFVATTPEQYRPEKIDRETAIILMTHSYVKDLQFLMALQHSMPGYIGLLGPSKRREKLLNEFLERSPEVEDVFFDVIHGPSGLNIGAETPQEIALSILSEILSVFRNQKPMMLKNKRGTIHS